MSSHHLFLDSTFATGSAARATGDTARGKVETVTRKDATRKQADGSDQKDSKTPGDPRMAVTDPRYHHPIQADDGYEMRDDASSPYENDSRNISKGSFDDKGRRDGDY